MKNTKDAIRYGMETLNITPEEMFSLIESSEGYEGDDYRRWLAAKIIEIAERDGVGFTQLLVKKFSITQSLAEEYSDEGIKEEWLSYMRKLFDEEKSKIYSVDIEGIGDELEGVDWFNGIDLDEINGNFVSKRLPEEFKKDFLEDNNVVLFCRLSSDSVDKSCELYKNAEIPCKNEGSLMLYRACSLVSAFEGCTENFKFAFLASTRFLCDSENDAIIRYFLNYFRYSGFVVSSTELLKDSFSKNEYAVVVCTPRTEEDSLQDGIVLRQAKLGNNLELECIGGKKRYSKSSRSMLDNLTKKSFKGTISSTVILNENEEFVESAIHVGIYGYLHVDNYGSLSIESLYCDNGETYIPITKENFRDIVVFYAVSKSLEGFGLARGISELVTGSVMYNELFYNCLPLFLCDLDNNSRDYGVVTVNTKQYRLGNKLFIENEYIQDMLENGEVLFSFESKQLLDVFKSFIGYAKENGLQGKSLKDINAVMSNEYLSKQYLTAINSLKDFISTLYRKM